MHKARAAVAPIADQLGLCLHRTAEAIIHVAISEMFVEANKLIARFGIDPRDFTLMAFGGAGPMLGCFLARELGMARVMVPHRPGVVSALGGLIADVRNDFIRTVFLKADASSTATLKDGFAALERAGEKWLRTEQGYQGKAVTQLSAEMRYEGQSFEVDVPLERSWIEAGNLAAITSAFHRLHAAIYDFNDEAAPVQIVNLRLVISGGTQRPSMGETPPASGEAVPAARVEVWLDGESRRVALYRRGDLAPGHRLLGPAVITQDDATVAIPSRFAASVDAQLNLHLEGQA